MSGTIRNQNHATFHLILLVLAAQISQLYGDKKINKKATAMKLGGFLKKSDLFILSKITLLAHQVVTGQSKPTALRNQRFSYKNTTRRNFLILVILTA